MRKTGLAGALADGAIVECLLSPSSVVWARRHLEAGATAAGRSLTGFHYVAWGICHLVDRMDQVPEAVRAMAGHLIAGMPDEVIGVLGLDPEKMTRLKADYAAGGPPAAAAHVGAAELERVTFVGTPDQCAQRFRALLQVGVDQVAVILLDRDWETNTATLRALARDVLPKVRP